MKFMGLLFYFLPSGMFQIIYIEKMAHYVGSLEVTGVQKSSRDKYRRNRTFDLPLLNKHKLY